MLKEEYFNKVKFYQTLQENFSTTTHKVWIIDEADECLNNLFSFENNEKGEVLLCGLAKLSSAKRVHLMSAT